MEEENNNNNTNKDNKRKRQSSEDSEQQNSNNNNNNQQKRVNHNNHHSLVCFEKPSATYEEDFFRFIKTYYSESNVEIEAKLGIINLVMNNHSNPYRSSNNNEVNRINFSGFNSEGSYDGSSSKVKTKFITNITSDPHARLNAHLNNLVQTKVLTHKHVYLLDKFYKDPNSGQDQIRVTYEVTKDYLTSHKIIRTLEIIKKTNLQNLDFHSPQSVFDYRLSAKREEKLVDFDLDSLQPNSNLERFKDRMSYQFQLFSFDLTMVDQSGKRQYEMEVELDREQLVKMVEAGTPKQKDHILKTIAVSFCANVRGLISIFPAHRN